MASKADRPVRLPSVFQNIFDNHFPEPPTPKKDTREEDKQEYRNHEKKRRDDE